MASGGVRQAGQFVERIREHCGAGLPTEILLGRPSSELLSRERPDILITTAKVVSDKAELQGHSGFYYEASLHQNLAARLFMASGQYERAFRSWLHACRDSLYTAARWPLWEALNAMGRLLEDRREAIPDSLRAFFLATIATTCIDHDYQEIDSTPILERAIDLFHAPLCPTDTMSSADIRFQLLNARRRLGHFLATRDDFAKGHALLFDAVDAFYSGGMESGAAGAMSSVVTMYVQTNRLLEAQTYMSKHKSDIEKGNFWIRTALLAQMGHLSKVYGSKQESEELLIRSFKSMQANNICPARLGDSVLIRPDLALGIDHPIVKMKGPLRGRKPLPRDWSRSFNKWVHLAQ